MTRSLRRFSALFVALLATLPLHAQTADEILTPAQTEALANAETDLRASLAPHASGQDAATATDILAVIGGERLPMPDRLSLAGAPCKVRSLQVTADIAIAYPFFSCAFRQEGPAGLVLQKDSGSQRRLGLLAPGEDGTSLIFIGGRYYGYEAPRGFSGFGSGDPAFDSLGLMYRGGTDRYYIIFAPTDGRSEVYEILTR